MEGGRQFEGEEKSLKIWRLQVNFVSLSKQIKEMQLKLINKTPDIVTPEVTANSIILRLGDIERKKLKDIYFDLELEGGEPLNITGIEAGCRACTKVFTTRQSTNKVEVRVSINWKTLINMFNKRIVFTYVVEGKKYKQEVFINGKII